MVGYNGRVLQRDDYFGLDMIAAQGLYSHSARSLTLLDTMTLQARGVPIMVCTGYGLGGAGVSRWLEL